MSRALTKAIRQSDMIGTVAFDSTVRAKSMGAVDFAPTGGLGTLAGWQEQAQYKERYQLFRGWVYAAINALAKEGAGQPCVVARLKGSSPREEEGKMRRKEFVRKKMTEYARTKTADTEFEILNSHPLIDLLDQPNNFQSKWQFVYSFISNLVLTGWAYVVTGRYKGKNELYCLPTTWIRPIHDPAPFSSFEIRNPRAVGKEPAKLKRNQVAFAHLPNPSDPLSALAPAGTQMMAIRIDDHIQTSQEAFFRNGIFPSVILTVGKIPYMDSEGRPVLTGQQRRQIHGAVRKLWGGVANYGNPAIVDGLIEKIERLSATHNEMGWARSEEKVRTRLLAPFGVHPYILGENVSVGGYAQVANIEKRFYKQVNTYLDMAGTLLTNLLGGFEGNERLIVWFEECQVLDPQLRQALLLAMRTGGDISQNELRAEAGFAPDEDLNQAVIQPAVMGEVDKLLGKLGQGQIQIPQAIAAMEGLGIPTEMAENIAGKDLPPPEPPAPPEPPPTPVGEGEEEEPEEGEVEEAVEELAKSNRLLIDSMRPDREVERILEAVECR